MKILATGAKGFIGKNLIASLKNVGNHTIFEYDIDSKVSDLDHYCQECDIVFHLAGINRPTDPNEFMKGNFGFTSTLLELLCKHDNKCPIILSSSIQAELDNPYGISKKAGEDLLFEYGKKTGSKILIYRFPNVFGKWCRPNYNSVVATFCHNIANNLPITINNPLTELNLIYIDDVIEELIKCLSGNETHWNQFCVVPTIHSIQLGNLSDLLYSFKNGRDNKMIPSTSNTLTKKLYATYLSYLPVDQFSYPLKMNQDPRGSFTEFIKTVDSGQVSINVAKPGITKGNHWHHTKNEKFLVVSGSAIIRFRNINATEVIEYQVSGEKLEVVDIPPGYTHNIQNIGETDLVTVMWANEPFDPNRPDTFFLEV